jgi:hypothetical protein
VRWMGNLKPVKPAVILWDRLRYFVNPHLPSGGLGVPSLRKMKSTLKRE